MMIWWFVFVCVCVFFLPFRCSQLSDPFCYFWLFVLLSVKCMYDFYYIIVSCLSLSLSLSFAHTLTLYFGAGETLLYLKPLFTCFWLSLPRVLLLLKECGKGGLCAKEKGKGMDWITVLVLVIVPFCCCKYAFLIFLPHLWSFPCWLLLCFVFSILTLVFLFCIYPISFFYVS